MEIEEEALRVRIYVGEADRLGREPLYKAIVHRLRERGVWGATVLRGVYGYGKKSVLHAAQPLRLSEDLPIVVEAVDAARKLEPLLPEIAAMVREGLVTADRVRVVRHVGGEQEAP